MLGILQSVVKNAFTRPLLEGLALLLSLILAALNAGAAQNATLKPASRAPRNPRARYCPLRSRDSVALAFAHAVSIDRPKGERPDIEYNPGKTVLLIKLDPRFSHLHGSLFFVRWFRAEAAARNAIRSRPFFFWKFLSTKVRVSSTIVFLTLSAGDPHPTSPLTFFRAVDNV
jgi:hypothetical protein